MCGIAGIINFNEKKISEREVKLALKSIKHRGPDDNGSWTNNSKNIALINTRLSIQDPSTKGSQPMISNDGRFVIIFNGEIYNFKYLKKNYFPNENFKSNSDTEVILKLFTRYNYKFLNLLEGMFAIAIYDKQNNKLFIARDEFGIKPLYYYIDRNKFIFSSEIKTFFELNIKREINPRSLTSYLTSEYYENKKHTYFKNILKLESGSYMEINSGRVKTKSYFDFYKYSKKIFVPKKFNERKERLNEIILKCVKNGMVSDVPISIAASGGLDSSILQYEAYKINQKAKLISWDFEENEFSEKKYVNQISKITNVSPIFYKIYPKKIINILKEIISINEEPFAGVPIISYYLALKNINNNKVILDGSGLDEANGGYDKYYVQKKKYNKLSQDGSYGIKNIINEKFLSNFPNYDKDLILQNSFKKKMFNDLFFVKLPRALRFRDKISMSLGFELRPIFLDKELIAYLHKLKREDHYKKEFTKFILRDTYKNKISKNIAFRKKRNIQTPQTIWFKKDLNKWLSNLLRKSPLWDTNLLDRNKFLLNYDLFNRGKINNSFFIWQFINLHYFIKKNDVLS